MSEELEELIGKWYEGRTSSEEDALLAKHFDMAHLKALLEASTTTNLHVIPPSKAYETFFNRQKSQSKRTKTTKWLIGILLGTLIIGIGYGLLNTPAKKLQQHIAPTDKVDSISMPDRTLIVLSPGSILEYASDTYLDERSISIEGSAYIDVPTPGPFEVIGPQVKVNVLGTIFEVEDITKGEAKVLCYEGKVKVDIGGRDVTLGAGSSIKMSKEEIKAETIDNVKPEWLRGQLTFDKAPLSAVIAAISNYYKVDIENVDIDLDELYSGVVPLYGVETSLRHITSVAEWNYEKASPNKYIISK